MEEELKNENYFEVFYHPNEYTRLFLFAFDSLEQAESLIQNSHPGFSKVIESDAKIPFISVNKKHSEEEMTKIFFCKIEN